MAKIIQVKLYKMHDYDLYMYYLGLRRCKTKSLSALMKEILVNYVRGQDFSAPQIEKCATVKPSGPIRIRFSLDEEKEADVLDFLNTIQYRQKSGFMKSLFRQSIGLSGLQNYIRNNNESYQEEPKETRKASAVKPIQKEEKKQEIKEEIVEKQKLFQPEETLKDADKVVHKAEIETIPEEMYMEEPEMEQTMFPEANSFAQDMIADNDSPGEFDFFGEMAKIMED